jgi:hypothetical protein
MQLTGISGSSPIASFAGAYELLPKSQWQETDVQIGDKGVTDNDMPVYRRVSNGGTSYIYYRWQEGLWAVGLKLHGKHYRLAAKVNTIEVYAKRPDMATGGWSLFYGNRPEWAPQIKCKCLMPTLAPTVAPSALPSHPPTISHTPSPTPAPAAAVVGVVHFEGNLFARTSEFKSKQQLAFRLGLSKSVGVPLGQVQLLMITQAYYMGGSASGIDVNFQVWPGTSKSEFAKPGGGGASAQRQAAQSILAIMSAPAFQSFAQQWWGMQGLEVSGTQFKFKKPDVHYHQQYLPDDGSWKPTIQSSNAHYRKNIRNILQSVQAKDKARAAHDSQMLRGTTGASHNPFGSIPSSVMSTMDAAKQLLQSPESPPRLAAGGADAVSGLPSSNSGEFARAGGSPPDGGELVKGLLTWADANQLGAIGLISVRERPYVLDKRAPMHVKMMRGDS